MTVTHRDGLTVQQMATVRAFVDVIKDLGVQMRLLNSYARISHHDNALAHSLFSDALRDARHVETVSYPPVGAISLEFLINIARSSEIIPEDFLPDEDTTKHMVDLFWEMKRNRQI